MKRSKPQAEKPVLEQRPQTMPHEARSSADTPPLTSPKIRDWHWQRKAVVYIRQSTPQQVVEHRESADRKSVV